MGEHVGRKHTTALIITKSMSCIYGANFKLKVIKHAEETSNCKAAWTFCYTKECTRLDKVKTTTSIIKGSELILKCIGISIGVDARKMYKWPCYQTVGMNEGTGSCCISEDC
jgi:hypothetical protein